VLPDWLQQLLILASPIAAAGGAWGATRVTLRWHWREIERAHSRIDRHDAMFLNWRNT
jgi:hypothetical protein